MDKITTFGDYCESCEHNTKGNERDWENCFECAYHEIYNTMMEKEPEGYEKKDSWKED